MARILRHIKRREWLMAAASLAFIVAQVWLDLKLPDYMAEITRLVQTPGSRMEDIWANGGLMLLCAVGGMAATVVVGFFAARIAASFSQRLRSLLFAKVESFSMEEISRFSTSSLITRSTNDVSQVQMLVAMGMMMIVRAPIMAVWAIAKIAGKGFEWTLATGATLCFVLLTVAALMVFVVPKFRRMQELTDNITRVTRESLTGLRVVRAYNAESYQEGKFEAANDELTFVQRFTGRAMSVMMPVMTLAMSGLSLAIYWIGAYLIDAAGDAEKLLLFSNMVVFSQYAMQVIMSFMMLSMVFILLPRASVSAKRINEVLDTEPAIVDGAAGAGAPGLVGEVEFRNVGFSYPGAAGPALEGVSFVARGGQTVAVIGSTGSGKSTLANLIPRFYDATAGEVLVDGVNVKEYRLESLQRKIGHVSQTATLFRGTVAANVGFGDNCGGEAAEEDIRRALAVAQADGFVEAMDEGAGSLVLQGGVNMSGGQKQRLSIARAVCRRPEIYIFDDSFSALDYRTDRDLRSALRRETKGATKLIVAQRIGTVMDADQIIVLDEGRVAGIGTHKRLLLECQVYKEIAMSQLSEEELAS